MSDYYMYQESVLVQYHCTENFPQQSNSTRETMNKGAFCKDMQKFVCRHKTAREIRTLRVSLSLCPNKNAILTVELYKLSKLYLLAQVFLIAARAS